MAVRADSRFAFDALRTKVARNIATDQQKIDFAVMAGELKETAAQELIYGLLGDRSEDVRYYALRTLVLESLDRSERAAAKCWKLFDDDSSGRVRGMAAGCIGSLLAGSKQPVAFARLKQRLAGAADEFEAELVLEALYNIAGRPPHEWPTQRRILSGRFGASPPGIEAQIREADDLERRFLAPNA